MDSKTTIAKLIKIAKNQQKIIEKLAQLVPPQGMNPNVGQHLSDQDAIKAKMGSNASQVATLECSTNELQGGATFKVVYRPAGKAANPAQLEKLIEDAVVAAQEDGSLTRKGSFYVEPAPQFKGLT